MNDSRPASPTPRPARLQLLVGSYFIVVAAVLIVPGLLLAERALRRRLEDARLAALETTMRGVVHGINERVAAAEGRVLRYAHLLSAEPSGADPAAIAEFDRLVAREADGAWRSRKSSFDPSREAGLYVPSFTDVDAKFKSFLIRAKHLTERFGAGALDPTLADAWVSPVEGGQVMFVPDQPNFLWDLAANEDFRATDWMRLAEPSRNPEGAARWTDPYHSEKTDAWFMSVVAPYTRGGAWGGSVGQDLSWQELVDYSAQTPIETGGRFLLIGRNGAVLLADSTTARNPARPEGRMLADLPDSELRDTLIGLLGRLTESGNRRDTPHFVRTAGAYLFWSGIPRTGWLVASVLPVASVQLPIHGPLRTTRYAVLLGLGGLLVASLISITREIRRRQGIEEGTRRAEERFRSLFQLSPDGVVLTRLDSGEVIEVNDSFVAMSGHARSEMMGRTTLDLGLWARPDHRDQVLAILRRDGVCRNFPTTLQRKDGRLVEIEFSGRVIEVEGHAFTLSILRDVEDQRRLERQLTHAQKMEAIGRLAGGVAHDFNNIMTAVMGYAQIASESLPEDAPARNDLTEILRASGRASELTRQLLAFARRQVTQPRPVDLNALIRETQKLLKRLLGEDIMLRTEPAPELPLVLVDPGQVEQVLVNLSVNARDAMALGGLLTIATRARGEEVLVDVLDTGVGIPPDALPYIFEPFFTTKEHGKGTGLGLSTCYGIVNQAGGRIEVTSEPGRGTRFRIVLPALPEGTLAAHTPARGTRIDAMTPGRGELILLAEDEPQVRQLSDRLLRGLGYRVLSAENGEAALSLAKSSGEPIDLLVTDVVMPGIGGAVLAAELRRLRPDLKVLYMSGYAKDSDAIERALVMGDSFLPKPFTLADLAGKVREVLEESVTPGER